MAKELGREYFILSLYLLLRHLAKYYVFTMDQYEIFKEFVIRFHERWREKKDEELISGAQKTVSTERAFDFDEMEDVFEEDRWKEKITGATVTNYVEYQIILRNGRIPHCLIDIPKKS